MSKNYNQKKIDNFLSKKYSYYFDQKRGNSYILNEQGFPVSAILTEREEYLTKSKEPVACHTVGAHYSSNNLGKIHYYLLMMHLNHKFDSYLKPSQTDDLTDITGKIWHSIFDDELVNKLELEPYSDEKDKIACFIFNKEPDHLYRMTSKKTINYFNEKELSNLSEICLDIFNEIYTEDYEKDEILDLIKENSNIFSRTRQRKKSIKR